MFKGIIHGLLDPSVHPHNSGRYLQEPLGTRKCRTLVDLSVMTSWAMLKVRKSPQDCHPSVGVINRFAAWSRNYNKLNLEVKGILAVAAATHVY